MSSPFFTFLTFFLTLTSSQRILEFTAESADYPIDAVNLGCAVDDSTNEIYCIGGTSSNESVYSYNNNDTDWFLETFTTELDVVDISNAEIIDGVMYFTSAAGSNLSSYDLENGTFSELANLGAESFSQVAAANGNILYITCGADATVQLYDTTSGSFIDTWTTQSSHPLGTAEFYEDNLYIIGGFGTTTNKLEYTDVNMESWVTAGTAAAVPDDFYHLTSVVTAEGYIYVIGGEISGAATNNILLYNINIDRVRTITITFPVTVYGSDCVMFMNSIWCMGGEESEGSYVSTVYVSNDLTRGGKGKGV